MINKVPTHSGKHGKLNHQAAIDKARQNHTNYSEADISKMVEIRQWLEDNHSNNRGLEQLSGVSRQTIGVLLSGAYQANPSERLKTLQSAIAQQDQRKAHDHLDKPLVKTTMYSIGASRL